MSNIPQKILVVEDEPDIRKLVQYNLVQERYKVLEAEDGEQAIKIIQRDKPNLVILDLMLPGLSGLEVCKQLRERPETAKLPILMLTAKAGEADRVVGLEMGADDYLPKPFEPRELLARLHAILRRGRAGAAADVLRFGRLEIDRGARAVRVDGAAREMTSHQFALLLALAESAGRVLSREALMEKLKGETLEAFDRSIDVHISRIRAAIEDDAKKPRRIVTVRGSGYVFARQQN
jgi:DNA-binding response OmpR family regulator